MLGVTIRNRYEGFPMIILVLGLFLFLGIHSVRMVAPQWRDKMLAERGEKFWKAIYSIVSIVGFVLIFWGYGLARSETYFIYQLPNWSKHITILLMFIAFTLLPFNMRSGRLAPMIKHPFLLAVILWSVGHLISNGDIASIVLFGSFLIWALTNRLSVGKRGGGPMPTAPLIQDVAAVLIGWVLWALFLFKFHAWLFGVSPI